LLAPAAVPHRSNALRLPFSTEATVHVSGLTILTRKTLVIRRFGADAWTQFFGDVARRHACFRSLILADTLVPLPAFLAFQDELMHRFFKEDEPSYVKLGRDASRWAVRDGPLKTLVPGTDLGTVVAALPKFHTTYFKDGGTWSEALVTNDGVEFKVHGLPEWHPYFEHFIVGYIAEVLELFCANPIHPLRLKGGGGKQYHYLLHGGAAADAAETAVRKLPPLVAETEQPLSSRELEVLSLVAMGRTNEEIGVALGISKKTAQHHVAHAYRKLGVSGRVGATVWLMERGLLGN
jgi:DNA-binding CsgD family transcriptional regulator